MRPSAVNPKAKERKVKLTFRGLYDHVFIRFRRRLRNRFLALISPSPGLACPGHWRHAADLAQRNGELDGVRIMDLYFRKKLLIGKRPTPAWPRAPGEVVLRRCALARSRTD
jgi:hypothetical protein